MGDPYGRSDINEISIGFSIWNMVYRLGIRYIDMVIYHIDIESYIVTLRPPSRIRQRFETTNDEMSRRSCEFAFTTIIITNNHKVIIPHKALTW